MKEYEDIASRNGYMYLYSLKKCKDKDIRYEVFDKEHCKHHAEIFTLRRSNRKKKSKDISSYMVGNQQTKSSLKISNSKQSSSNGTKSVQSESELEKDMSSSPNNSHSTQGGKESSHNLLHKNNRTNSLSTKKVSTNSLSEKKSGKIVRMTSIILQTVRRKRLMAVRTICCRRKMYQTVQQ